MLRVSQLATPAKRSGYMLRFGVEGCRVAIIILVIISCLVRGRNWSACGPAARGVVSDAAVA